MITSPLSPRYTARVHASAGETAAASAIASIALPCHFMRAMSCSIPRGSADESAALVICG
ncbi:hypothetical protein [Stenotrophomonas sp. ZAC14D2_NAIMI4_7]|uniref:hypothetical protein n=1 Tax=Stenotrophomonas sp. ZAC14D2_NAIMI4_7 TaxID=2072405 RepID=UPI001F49180A|nr:hypothetical protein [Stenotrophomonas sp. ZAC14D2_NAIMI4_7]